MTATPEETLGQEFWTQPETLFGGNEVFSLMYSTVLAVFREENRQRNGSAIDLLVAERIASMYVYLRFREADVDTPMTDRTRREMNKDVLDLLTQMKKLWLSEDRDNAAEAVMKKANGAILNALKDMPESEARAIQRALAESFEASGL